MIELQARLSTITGKAASSADAPNKINLKFDPLYLSDDDASWLFEHLGQFLSLRLDHTAPTVAPLDEALEQSRNGHR